MQPAHIADTGGDLSPGDVAAVTGLSRSLIYREIERGNLAAYRVGARLRVEPAAVAAWKERCRVRPRSEPPIYELVSCHARSSGPLSGFARQLAEVEKHGRAAA